MKARNQPVRTVSFVPPMINTGHPDIDRSTRRCRRRSTRSEGEGRRRTRRRRAAGTPRTDSPTATQEGLLAAGRRRPSAARSATCTTATRPTRPTDLSTVLLRPVGRVPACDRAPGRRRRGHLEPARPARGVARRAARRRPMRPARSWWSTTRRTDGTAELLRARHARPRRRPPHRRTPAAPAGSRSASSAR